MVLIDLFVTGLPQTFNLLKNKTKQNHICEVQKMPVLRKLFFFFFLIYSFLSVLGSRLCARAFSSCGEQGLLFVAVRGLLIAVASLVAEHGL